MSFSLSSLLNPSDEAAAKQQLASDDSVPQQIESPEQQHVALPEHTPPPPHRPSSSTPHEQIAALSAFASSSAAPPMEWNGYTVTETGGLGQQAGNGAEREQPLLPLAPPAQRKMSSPSLDQYHVPSRSPEQTRPTLATSSDPAFALPSIGHIAGAEQGSPHASLDIARESYSGVKVRGSDVGRVLHHTSSRAELAVDSDRPYLPSVQSEAPPPTMITEMVSTGSDEASVKQEARTPQPTSSTEARRPSIQPTDLESKAVATLKSEYSARYQSPLRESSTPMLSTEMSAPDSHVPKKRPAPKKKGTATATKKGPPSKRRKVEVARSDTPSSRATKPGSNKGTPVNSSPAPSGRSQSAGVGEDDDDEEEGSPVSDDLYCICRRPDTGTFMIGCDGTCDDWFHGKCVGIEERDKNLIDKYMCPGCTSSSVGKTTWKRMCRRVGCRQAARVGKNKSGGTGSKYCSDECGVVFFREMTANARGREQAAKSRASRRSKTGNTDSDMSELMGDLGARGGILAPGEVRALLDGAKTLEDFKKLGESVLSPPATPHKKPDGVEQDLPDRGRGTLTSQEAAELAEILSKKQAARERHSLLKDRLKFVNLVKQAASRAMTEKDLKAKDYCGFDPRLRWNEDQFAIWRNSAAGKRAFELDTLDAAPSEADADAVSMLGQSDIDRDTVFDEVEVCEKKKCARHHEWAKLATDDVRFEMGDNGDRMRLLEREERSVRERAAMRARGDAEANGDGEDLTAIDVSVVEQADTAADSTTRPSSVQATVDEDIEMANGTDHAIKPPTPATEASFARHVNGDTASVNAADEFKTVLPQASEDAAAAGFTNGSLNPHQDGADIEPAV